MDSCDLGSPCDVSTSRREHFSQGLVVVYGEFIRTERIVVWVLSMVSNCRDCVPIEDLDRLLPRQGSSENYHPQLETQEWLLTSTIGQKIYFSSLANFQNRSPPSDRVIRVMFASV